MAIKSTALAITIVGLLMFIALVGLRAESAHAGPPDLEAEQASVTLNNGIQVRYYGPTSVPAGGVLEFWYCYFSPGTADNPWLPGVGGWLIWATLWDADAGLDPLQWHNSSPPDEDICAYFETPVTWEPGTIFLLTNVNDEVGEMTEITVTEEETPTPEPTATEEVTVEPTAEATTEPTAEPTSEPTAPPADTPVAPSTGSGLAASGDGGNSATVFGVLFLALTATLGAASVVLRRRRA